MSNQAGRDLRDEIVRGTHNIDRMRREIHIVLQTIYFVIFSKTNHLNEGGCIRVVHRGGSDPEYVWEIKGDNIVLLEPISRRAIYSFENRPLRSDAPATKNVQMVWESLPSLLSGLSEKIPEFGPLLEPTTRAAQVFTELMLDVGQANEIKLAAKRNGLTSADLKRLSEDSVFATLLPVLRGYGTVVIKDHIVNGDKPFIPDGWKLESHKKTGKQKLTRDGDNLFLDGKKIDFFLSPNQGEGRKSTKGDKLRKELEGKPVLNACVLDYLREHPELIPESWKVDEKGRTRYIFFWGTIYRYPDGGLYVRYLCWHDGQWVWGYFWLDVEWDVDSPAAVLAS